MYETKVHLPKAKQCAITEPRNPADGQCEGVTDNLGSTQRQGTGRQTSSQPGQSLWRKRRAKGQVVYARNQEN